MITAPITWATEKWWRPVTELLISTRVFPQGWFLAVIAVARDGPHTIVLMNELCMK